MAAAIFQRGMTDKDRAALAVLGLTEEDFPEEELEIWPENVPAYGLFSSLRTQWRAGGMGVLGLDYNTLFHKMDRMPLSPEEYLELEEDIRTMEHAALAVMYEKDE